MSCQSEPSRPAFTLIELLVVITLIAILAGIAAAFLPAIGDASRQAQAGTMVQQWILTAKQKALRDQAPYGIRLYPTIDPKTGRPLPDVRKCRFIEQPDDFTVSPFGKRRPNGTYDTSYGKIALVDVRTMKMEINMPYSGQIVPGDALELFGSGIVCKVQSANAILATGTTALTLSSLPPYVDFTSNPPKTFEATNQYRFIHSARLTGDDAMQLPDGIMIDIKTNADYGNPLPAANYDGTIDILFAPSGAVISPGTVTESINLWVRDFIPTNSNPNLAVPPDLFDGQQTIIAVYVRSGATAAHPPAPPTQTSSDPYAFIKDGRSSGR